MRLIGLVLVLTVVVLATLVGGTSKPYRFFDNPSYVFLCGFVGGCLLLSGTSIRLLGRSIRSRNLADDEIAEAVRAWRNTRAFSVAGGCLGTLIGVISILHALGDPDFGLALQTASIPLFFGLVFGYGICLPLQYRVEGLASGSGRSLGSEFIPALVLAVLLWLVRVLLDYLAHL